MHFLHLIKIKEDKMNNLKNRIPFAFWLVKHFISDKRTRPENTRPVSNQELYSVLGIIVAALAILKIVF